MRDQYTIPSIPTVDAVNQTALGVSSYGLARNLAVLASGCSSRVGGAMNEKFPTQRLHVQNTKGISALLARLLCMNRIVSPTSLFRKSVVVTMRTISDAHWGRHGM
jgi:hypothetical protein